MRPLSASMRALVLIRNSTTPHPTYWLVRPMGAPLWHGAAADASDEPGGRRAIAYDRSCVRFVRHDRAFRGHPRLRQNESRGWPARRPAMTADGATPLLRGNRG